MTDNNHAIQNAQSWAESLVEAQQREDDDAAEDADRAIYEAPLSVQYRTDWHDGAKFLAEEKPAPSEVCILLTTGGPGLRVVCPLEDTTRARLEWQDWGTPWTEHRLREEKQRDALACFVDRFTSYFC